MLYYKAKVQHCLDIVSNAQRLFSLRPFCIVAEQSKTIGESVISQKVIRKGERVTEMCKRAGGGGWLEVSAGVHK